MESFFLAETVRINFAPVNSNVDLSSQLLVVFRGTSLWNGDEETFFLYDYHTGRVVEGLSADYLISCFT